MANEEHVAILRQGVEVWNQWRKDNPDVRPDLDGADLDSSDLCGVDLVETDLNQASMNEANLIGAYLTGTYLRGAKLFRAKLSGANLRGAKLLGANLEEADIRGANLRGAKLFGANVNKANLGEADLPRVDLRGTRFHGATFVGANLSGADLRGADLSEVDLQGANLFGANLFGTNLSKANLSGANLMRSTLIEAHFENAILSKCRIYGISAWNVNLTGAMQSDLVISDEDQAEITVDNLEIAQFVYMLLNNAKIRDVIDTLTTKAVLILGRFTDDRKAVLDAIKNELRQRNYVPILFDFEKPASRDLTETIVTLAHLSRFVIADITDAKSIPQELQAIVPNLLSVPIQPIILAAQREYALFEHFRRYPSVLPLHEYASQDQLIAELPEKVIEPAEHKVEELRG